MDVPWRQVNAAFSDWQTAERTAVTHLAPLPTMVEDKQLITAWSFIRKSGPPSGTKGAAVHAHGLDVARGASRGDADLAVMLPSRRVQDLWY
ncbi:hypothetical protein ACIBP6_15055 [Nonomuraea terrae]|uniref:hypothetical protein n=1 Tax=Nonomuraea terrae TaxID=2530383 RepID=UPI00379FB90B